MKPRFIARLWRVVPIALIVSILAGLAFPRGAFSDQTILQPDGTAGIDTWMNSAAPTATSGTSTSFRIGEDDTTVSIRRGLLKFDVSSIPVTATVTGATLTLTTSAADQAANDATINVYPDLRAWSEANATWNVWDTGNNWTTGGSGSAGNDFTDTVMGTFTVTNGVATGTAFTFTLSTSVVQGWVDGGLANNGMLLRTEAEVDDLYLFATSDNSTVARRPKLVVDYSLATPTPTPTNTLTPSNTPTDTLTPSNTPTDTLTPSNTPTPSDTPTPTPSNTPTPTPTFTPLPTAIANCGGGTTVVLRPGAEGFDSMLDQGAASTNYGSAITATVGGESGGAFHRRMVIKFDLASIPTDAVIDQAVMCLYLVSEGHEQNVNIAGYPLLRDWVEDEVTWNIWKTGNNWTTAGATSVGDDREGTAIGSFTLIDNSPAGTEFVMQLTASRVQDWLAGSNYGLIVQEDMAQDSYSVWGTSDHGTAAYRPALAIDYHIPTATPTLTPSPTLTVTATSTITPTDTLTPTPSDTPTITLTPSATLTPTITLTPSLCATDEFSFTVVLSSNNCARVVREISVGEIVTDVALFMLFALGSVYFTYRIVTKWITN